MTSLLPFLACLALSLFALKVFDEAFANLQEAGAALRHHHDERYLLYYCGAYLAAHGNLSLAATKLKELGASAQIAADLEGKAKAYRARLDQRLASIGHDAAYCQQLTFGGYRLALYEQNPSQPDNWPNLHFTLIPLAHDRSQQGGHHDG